MYISFDKWLSEGPLRCSALKLVILEGSKMPKLKQREILLIKELNPKQTKNSPKIKMTRP